MRSIGGYMFFFGLGSMVLHYLNLDFVLLMWVDNWGERTGWLIRILLAVIGGLIWFFPRNLSQSDD